MDWLMVNGSQLLNIMTGGRRGEMFCARCHRNGWWLAKLIDAMVGDNHCAACYRWDRRHNGRQGDAQR